jgi:hypothetical protein
VLTANIPNVSFSVVPCNSSTLILKM